MTDKELKPEFWYRPCCDGEMYEGPVHNDSGLGKMLRNEKPNEWVPLYTADQLKAAIEATKEKAAKGIIKNKHMFATDEAAESLAEAIMGMK